jgi:hypothetical protein
MPIIKKYNKDFFKTWSRDMAYIIGFLCADGGLTKTTRGTHFITFYSMDKELLERIRVVISSEHMLSKRSVRSGSVYRLQLGSKEWFEDLSRLGLTVQKTDRMQLPAVPKEFLGDFVRGYFDGDGNVWVGYVHGDRQTQTCTIQTTFTSASSDFLESLKLSLHNFGLAGGSLFRPSQGNYARLTFSKQDTLKIYKIMYNARHKLYLKRKKVVFDKFVKTQSIRLCGCSSAG